MPTSPVMSFLVPIQEPALTNRRPPPLQGDTGSHGRLAGSYGLCWASSGLPVRIAWPAAFQIFESLREGLTI